MNENTAETAEFSLAWDELDVRFQNKEIRLESIFDDMISRQIKMCGDDPSEPCVEARELLDQWKMDDDDFDYLPDWRAAVARSQPRLVVVKTDLKEVSGVAPVEDDATHFNHAELLGVSSDAFQEFLNKPASLMIGEMWGQRDRRNTQDKDWKSTSMPWLSWLAGQPGDGNNAEWGLSRHPEGKYKEGASIVLGSSIGGARKAKAMETMYALGLDVDSGARLEDVLKIVESLNLFTIVYTSYNNGKRGLKLKRDDVLRKLKITSDPDIGQIRQYLHEVDKNRYEESFINGVQIVSQKKQDTDGVKIVLSTPPLEKFRLIFPLAAPVKIIDLAETHDGALKVWEDKVTGMAVEKLGVNFDTSCTDPSRLFFTARHHKDSEDWGAMIVQGEPLRFEDVPEYKKSLYTAKREKLNAFEIAGGGGDDERPAEALTPSGKSLNDWHRSAQDRFLLANLLEDTCSDRIVIAGGEAEGHVHIECPFEHEHSSTGGTANMAVNCIDNPNGYWTWFCHHDACQGRHKLAFLEEALRQEWFDEADLFDEGGVYLLEPADEEEKATFETRRNEALEALTAKVHALDKNASDAVIRDLLTQAHADLDDSGKDALFAEITAKSHHKLRSLNKMWKEIAAKIKKDAHTAQLRENDRSRAKMTPTEYVPLSEATLDTVTKAAAASKWLPSDFAHSNGWFRQNRDDKNSPIIRQFEVVYSADGAKGNTRTNEITIRYQHRTEALGIVESTFRIGECYQDSGTILGRLSDEGLEFSPSAPTPAIQTLLRSIHSEREAVFIEQSGWTSDRKAFISPTGEVVKGPDDKSKCLYVLDSTMRVSAAKNGSLEMAIGAAAAALRGRNAKHFLPAFLGGAVGCLAEFLDEELAVIIANEGKAKHGKTTALKAGISWFAPAAADGLLITGNVTPTANERMAVKSSGVMFAADEQGTSAQSAEDEQRMALQYAGRIGRGRGTTDGGMRDVQTWHGCMGMSTERGLLARLEAEQSRDGGVEIRSGALSRIFTVNYDTAMTLDKEKDADELEAYDILAHGGANSWLGPEFARKLIELGVDAVKKRVSALEKEWAKNVDGSTRSGAAQRVVTTAALFGVAAEIAQEAGLLLKNSDLEGDNARGLKDMFEELLSETLIQRERHLDTEQQALNMLRMSIIKRVNSYQIIPSDDRDSARGKILGYFTTKGGSGPRNTDPEDHTYILPIDRLSELVKIEESALVEKLREKGGLVEPSERSKYARRGLWESTPNEGKRVKSLRVSGKWVHGAEEDSGEGA